MSLKANAIISLDELKESLSITGTDKDSLLTNLINRTTSIIESYCKTSFKQATYKEEYDGYNEIILKHFPVKSVSLVEYSGGDLGNLDWETIDSDFYKLEHRKSDSSSPVGILKLSFNLSGVDRIRITYIGGPDDIPDDVKQVCIDICSYFYNSPKSANIKSETLGEYSVSYQSGGGADIIQQLGENFILDQYRTPSI